MNRKLVLRIILVIILITIGIIILLSIRKRYNKLVISDSKWNDIINSRTLNTNIKLDNIMFNDYNLIIDEQNSTIYYSIVESKNKYNPKIKYEDNDLKIAFSDKLNSNNIKLIIYNDNYYHIYNLVVTDLPMINISYNEDNLGRKIPIKLYLFDNHIDAYARVMKSDGKLVIIENNKEYRFSLMKESLGHNERKNNISIFGMEKHNEYVLRNTEEINHDRHVNLFINNEYMGVYALGYIEERRMNPNGPIKK